MTFQHDEVVITSGNRIVRNTPRYQTWQAYRDVWLNHVQATPLSQDARIDFLRFMGIL